MSTTKEKITFYADPDISEALAQFDSGARTRVINKLLRTGLANSTAGTGVLGAILAAAEPKGNYTAANYAQQNARIAGEQVKQLETIRGQIAESLSYSDPLSRLQDRISQLEQSQGQILAVVSRLLDVLAAEREAAKPFMAGMQANPDSDKMRATESNKLFGGMRAAPPRATGEQAALRGEEKPKTYPFGGMHPLVPPAKPAPPVNDQVPDLFAEVDNDEWPV